MLNRGKSLKKYFTTKLVIIYLIVFLLSLMQIKDFHNPFFLSSIFALFSISIPSIIPIILGCIGVWISSGFNEMLFCIITIIVFVLSFFVINPKYKNTNINLSKNVVLTLAIVQILYLIKLKNAVNVYQLISGAIFIFIFYVIFKISLDYIYNYYFNNYKIITNEEIISISLTLLIISLVFDIKILNFNIYTLIFYLIMCYISYKHGLLTGMINTIITTLFYFGIFKTDPNFMVVNIITTFILGVLSKTNKKYFIATMFTMTAIYIYLYPNNLPLENFIELFVSCLIMLIFVNYKQINARSLVIHKKLLPEMTIRSFNLAPQVEKKQSDSKAYKLFKNDITELYANIQNNLIAQRIVKDNAVMKQIFKVLVNNSKITYTDLIEVLEKQKKFIISTEDEDELIVKPQLNGLVSNLNLVFENLNYDSNQENTKKAFINKDEKKLNVNIKTKYMKQNFGVINYKIIDDIFLIGYVENIETKKQMDDIKFMISKIINVVIEETKLNTDNIFENANLKINNFLNEIIIMNRDISFQLVIVNVKNNKYNLFRYNSPSVFGVSQDNVYLLKGKREELFFEKFGTFKKGVVIMVNNEVLDSYINFNNKELGIKYYLRDNEFKTNELADKLLENSCNMLNWKIEKSLIVITFEITKEGEVV